jgi:hypothetical protein
MDTSMQEDQPVPLSAAPPIARAPSFFEEEPPRRAQTKKARTVPPSSWATSQVGGAACPEGYQLVRGFDEDGCFAMMKQPPFCLAGVPRKCVRNDEVADWQLDDDAFLASFALPGKDNKCDILQSAYPFERDKRIVFYESDHKYIIDGTVRAPRSVTKIVHQFEVPFDGPMVVAKMKASANWAKKKKEYLWPDATEMTNAQILRKWAKNGDVSSKRGTLLHWHCEMFMNGSCIYGPFSTEFSYFLDFYEKYMLPKGLIPVRTEFSIFHTGLAVAGQIDVLLKYYGTDKYVIADYKRSKEIKEFNRWQQLKEPFDHLDSTNLNTYTLQLLMYRYILQTEYGLDVDELLLVVLHENEERARVISLPLWDEEVERIVKYEREKRNTADPNGATDAVFAIDHLTNLDWEPGAEGAASSSAAASHSSHS